MVSLTLELIKNTLSEKNTECLKAFAPEVTKKVAKFHQSMWGYYHETPLVELPELASFVGVKDIFVKDESKRFGLNAFKALGGSYAICSYLAKLTGEPLDFDGLMSKNLGGKVGNITFATTTDGNHGRGVAWTSRILGYKAEIYMPKGSAKERVDAIRKEGAEVRVTNCNYDDTVKMLAQDAKNNNWVVIQDTAWPGYEDIPMWIMQGYSTMVEEALNKLTKDPTHIFVQAGVGSMAAAVAAVVANKAYATKPKIIVLEAEKANCFFKSFSNGSPTAVGGDLDTIMAGLACGEVNPLAWEILKNYCDFAMSCKDEVGALGMRILGNPLGKDEKIVSGESGAIGAGVLGILDKYHNLKTDLGLNEESVVLLFSTEGDTYPTEYRDIVWGGKFATDFRLEKTIL